MQEPVARYLCLSVDVVGYGRHDDRGQAVIQRDLVGLLDAAAEKAGLDRGSWLRQAKGDEELCLIPSGEALHRVVGAFCLHLDRLVREANLMRDHADRTRLRLAMDDGPAQLASNGYTGRAVVGVSRLVNSGPVRQALKVADAAALAVILSDGVFRDWVRSGLSGLDADRFRRVRVVEKEVDDPAWLWVPGTDTHRLPLEQPGTAEPGSGAAGGVPQVANNFHGTVEITGGDSTFGIRNG